MKYVVALVVVVVLVRIDVLLRLFDKASDKIEKVTTPASEPVEVKNSEIIPFKEDKSARVTFLAILKDFKINPDSKTRMRVVQFLDEHKELFKGEFDKELEGVIFGLRDLIPQKEAELAYLLMDLLKTFTGENQEIIKRFFTVLMDQDLERFIMSYSKSKDTNCLIATLLGDPLPSDAAYFVLKERDEALATYLSRNKIDPLYRSFAENCRLVLSLHLPKIAPPPEPVEENADEESQTP